MEYTIRIGGEAGRGLQLIGRVLAKYFTRAGFHVFTHQDTMSRISGGHNFYQIRLADHPLSASRGRVDLVLAFDQNSVDIHHGDLTRNGIILYDADICRKTFQGQKFLNVPLMNITEEMMVPQVMINSAAMGAVLGLLDLNLNMFAEIMADFLPQKDQAVIATNLTVAQAAFDYVIQEFPNRATLPATGGPNHNSLLLNGNQAIGLGALLSGCKFYAAYPMPPSTDIMVYLAAQAKKHGLVVEQAEDEIAAINMALGASYGGVRAMTATSGGGFALMSESLSLAGMTETPLVIAEVQRPGPATGMPSRTEQSDLLFVIHGGHGEFPRVVFAPGSPEQAFSLTNKAFHLAEKYQIPVIILSDQYLGESEWTSADFDTSRLLNEDFRLRRDKLSSLAEYQRYADQEKGVSPLAIPGASVHLVVADSDEHDAEGHIIEDSRTRKTMMRKRLDKKMPKLRQEISPPTFYGAEQAEVLLVGFGSTYGVLKEAIEHLRNECSIGMLHFSEVYPFPSTEEFDYLSLLKQAAQTLCIENNATGQFAHLLHGETGFKCSRQIHKYDGRPFDLDSLTGEIHDRLSGI